jgi:V/A-type H+/Na+-transporting ATPase subunit E
MAFENLLMSVEESAQEKEQELKKKAGQLAEEIRTGARKEAEAIQERAVREAERSATIERNKQLYLARGGIRQRILKSREKIFAAAFDEAKQQLSRLREDPAYPATFARLAREATGAMGGAAFRVHVDPRDLELCTKTLASLGVRCEVLPDIMSAGGLVVSSPDGFVTIANTVESRLERARERRRLSVYTALFGD